MELSYKSIATALLILAGTTASLKAQDIQIDDKYVENDVVSLAGK